MPQVKQRSTFFGGKEFIMRVRVGKDGTFRISVPKYAQDALGLKEVTGETLDKAERTFEKLRVIYGNSLTENRRVIGYTFSINNKAERHGGPVKRNDMSFCAGAGVVLSVENYLQTEHKNADGDHLRYSYRSDDKQPYPPEFQFSHFNRSAKEGHVIEWTEKNEAFFVCLCNALLDLIDKLESLDDNQEALLEFASSGQLLLGN